MNKELDYFNIAGELQAKSYQFNALGLSAMNGHFCISEILALRYIENLIGDLEEYKELLKKKRAEEEEFEKERRFEEKY